MTDQFAARSAVEQGETISLTTSNKRPAKVPEKSPTDLQNPQKMPEKLLVRRAKGMAW